MRKVVALAWTRFQPRTAAIAAALGGEARFFDDGIAGSSLAAKPLAYAMKAIATWRTLTRSDPDAVLVITPPVFAPMVTWVWCALHGRTFVVDCHTGAFHSGRWAWARPLHRLLLRRAKVVLLHTSEFEQLVRGWGANALLVPDDVPDSSEAAHRPRPEASSCVVVAGSLDRNEPVEAAIEAARRAPQLRFRFTGDTRLVPGDIVARAPENVFFTGYIAYPLFLGELEAADAVAVFSTDPRIMNRAAFEAIGLGRPLVLSDLPALKVRFGDAAVLCANEPDAMANAVAEAVARKEELATRSVALQVRLKAQRAKAMAQVQSIVNGDMRPTWRSRSTS